MHIAIVAAGLLHLSPPLEVADAHTGAAVKLPAGPLCVTLPVTDIDAAACAPKSVKEVEADRKQLRALDTARASNLALVRTRSGAVISIISAKVASPRKGKLPPGFLHRLFDDMAKGAADDDGRIPTFARHGDETYEIETYNGITAARAETTLTYGKDALNTVQWVVLAPNGNFTVSVAGTGAIADLRKEGTAVMATLSMPEAQRVDLSGRTPIP